MFLLIPVSRFMFTYHVLPIDIFTVQVRITVIMHGVIKIRPVVTCIL